MCPGFESLIRHHILVRALLARIDLRETVMPESHRRGFRRLARHRLVRYGRITLGPLALIAAGIAALMVTISALAQAPFAIPANARAGRFIAQQFPMVTIDGRDYRLAPGARIYSRNHLTLTPNLVPIDSPVKFALNSDGQIQTVWLIDAKDLPKGERRTGPRGN